MAEGPLKFRCYQCNQLLGVPPKRAGSVIACPRCGADLLVPRPESGPAPGTVMPEISIEPPSILPAYRQTGPVREVLIQPAVLLVWSMIVLLSLPMAFIAGLLIGHFLWRFP